ncbi:radical SAM protein [Desulfamplus magnetovallimortis]|nr:radical SAM protein [Desulfamplus magnetovallimortis]
MIKDEYSPFKVVHHFDKLKQLQQGEQITPVQIHLIPTNRCNQNCVFCAYRLPDYPSAANFNAKDEIPEAKLIEIIDSCKTLGVKAIQFTGGGEPLVHPAILKAFQKTLENGLDLALVSNGQALTDDMIHLLADVSWVRISMDACHKKTYSLIRRVKGDIHSRVSKNIEKLARIKKGTILGVGFVVNAENHREIYDACRYFKELGADNFRISAAFTSFGMDYFKGFLEQAKDMASQAKQDFEDKTYKVFNLFNDRISDLFQGTQNYPYCPMKEFVPYIGADETVYTCCMLAYNKLGRIGSIKDQAFEALWESEEKEQFFKYHDPRKYCQIPCMFQGKNEFINYAVKTDARHINFI